MTTDLAALIAEARATVNRGWFRADYPSLASVITRLSDTLESTLAELRQERERADELQSAYFTSSRALSRAEEDIDRALGALDPSTGDGAALDEARTILTEYSEQKEADRG